MALAFEQRIKSRATSRQDYIQRANAGVRNILAYLKNTPITNYIAGGAKPETTVPSADRQTPAPIDGAALSALQSAALSGVNPSNGIPSSAATVDPFIQELVAIAKSAASTVAQMDTSSPTTVSPVTGVATSQMQTSAPSTSELHKVVQQPVSATPRDEQIMTTKQEDQEQEITAEGKDQDVLAKKPKGRKPTTRSTRRTSRPQASRPSTRETPSNPSGQEPTPPTTRSRARKATKRAPRKKATRGRRRASKESERAETAKLGSEKEATTTPQPTLLEQAGRNVEKNPEASERCAGKTGTGTGSNMDRMANAMYMMAQEFINEKSKTNLRSGPQLSPSSDGRHPSRNIALNSSAGVPDTNALDPDIMACTEPARSYAEGSGSTRKQAHSTEIPPGTAARLSTSNAQPSNAHQPPYCGVSDHQNSSGTPEYVRFCSNGNVEIEDGITVTQDDLLIAAATIGIMLTADQLRSLKRDQALIILVKASQLKLMEDNCIAPPMGSPLFGAQGTPGDMRRQPVRPHMMGPLHASSNLRPEPRNEAQAFPQAPIHAGIPTNSQQEGTLSHPATPVAAAPNITSTGPGQGAAQRTPPLWRFTANVPEVHARLRKFQMDYKKYMSLLHGQLAEIRARGSDSLVRYLRCCINLLAMDTTRVRGVSVDVIDNVENFLRDFLNQHAGSTLTNDQRQNANSIDRNGGQDMSELHRSGFRNSTPQNDPRSMPETPVYPIPMQSGHAQSTPLPNGIPNAVNTGAGVGPTTARPSTNLQQQGASTAYTWIGNVVPHDQNNSRDTQLPIGSESNGRKRKTGPTPERESNGKRMAASKMNGDDNRSAQESILTSQEMARSNAQLERCNLRVAPADLIDITDESRPPVGVAVYCQKDKNGNMFSLLRLSDSPDLEEVLGRLRFMLNCAMKLTTCYISVSEGKEEDKTRRLEEVVVSLEPRKFDSDRTEDDDQPDRIGLSMIDLINAECAEARKRYGSLTVQMVEEFERPIFRCILRYNDRPFPRLELRVAGRGKDDPKVYGYERPPMGWVGVLEQVRKLFCSSLGGGKGVEAMIRAWMHTKEEFNGWKELRERSEEEVRSA